MADPATTQPTYADYLALEAVSPDKHEWIAGEIRAMAGSTATHARLCAQLTTILGQRLRGKPCAPYSADLRVRAESIDVSTYPDISVVCGEPQRASDDKHGFVNPTLLVEVSSPSTERYDRGEKFEYYRALDTLRDYVLVSQHEPLITHFCRDVTTGRWSSQEYGPGEQVRIKSLGLRIAVNRVYEGIALEPRPPRPARLLVVKEGTQTYATQ